MCTFYEQTINYISADSTRTFEWRTSNTMTKLQCSVLNFYCLSAKIFILKNGFAICFLMKTLRFHNLRLKHVERKELLRKIVFLKNYIHKCKFCIIKIRRPFSFSELLIDKVCWSFSFFKAVDRQKLCIIKICRSFNFFRIVDLENLFY